MKQIYFKYWDKCRTIHRGILFLICRIFSAYRRGDGQYTPDNLNLVSKATRLYLLFEFQNLVKSTS